MLHSAFCIWTRWSRILRRGIDVFGTGPWYLRNWRNSFTGLGRTDAAPGGADEVDGNQEWDAVVASGGSSSATNGSRFLMFVHPFAFTALSSLILLFFRAH